MRFYVFKLSIVLIPLFSRPLKGFGQKAEQILLSHYRPVSIYNTPETRILRASFPAIDMHSHDFYVKTAQEVAGWVRIMDSMGIQRTTLLTCQTGKVFDSIIDKFKSYPERFQLWCGFDYTGYGTADWPRKGLAELQRCHAKGAKGIGELADKGIGEIYSGPAPGNGIHIDDPKMRPLLQKCGDLHMPVSIHLGEDAWMYQRPDSTNDGMMNAGEYQVDMSAPHILDHEQLLQSLEHALMENPKTIFIACHLANCCINLQRLGRMLDKYPNLYADIAARYGEIAPIPRFSAAFISTYQDRLLFGTDSGTDPEMYKTTFRILETADEHFYAIDLYDYHWALYGLNLPKSVLKKLYYENAEKILGR
jgi:uncharacterized protein